MVPVGYMEVCNINAKTDECVFHCLAHICAQITNNLRNMLLWFYFCTGEHEMKRNFEQLE